MYIARILVDLGTGAKPPLCKVIFNYVVIFSIGKFSLAACPTKHFILLVFGSMLSSLSIDYIRMRAYMPL